MAFTMGKNVFGPKPEIRRLDAIRQSLADPNCNGPEEVYAIVMDVGKTKHLDILQQMHLLYGAVTYAAGQLGREPVRSQGHIHIKNPRNGWSTPEVYEIWEGRAIIYMQERADDDPGRCFAVHANAGDVVVVPPGWAHATISADPKQPLTFGAWCDRDYGFEYEQVRAHRGLAWYPQYDDSNQLKWHSNPRYTHSKLIEKAPAQYDTLHIEKGIPIYSQFEKDTERFRFVPEPFLKETVWKHFTP
jgi:glucose-6-phosphate isomerase